MQNPTQWERLKMASAVAAALAVTFLFLLFNRLYFAGIYETRLLAWLTWAALSAALILPGCAIISLLDRIRINTEEIRQVLHPDAQYTPKNGSLSNEDIARLREKRRGYEVSMEAAPEKEKLWYKLEIQKIDQELRKSIQ